MLTIRQARPSDCEGMRDIHRAAVLEHYSRTYREQANAWAEQLQTAAFDQALAGGMTIVAEESSLLLGFARFDADTARIDLSVRPEAEKRAISSALLAVIETEARSRSLETLQLCALLYSEHLYLPSGFVATGAAEFPLFGGPRMPCVTMEKRLEYAEIRQERRRNGLSKVAVDRGDGTDA
jgi:GNAT superfamily N-acetyltransferase